MNPPQSSLLIALLPLDIVPGQPEANLLHLEQSLDQLTAKPDLVIVPELFTTGFSTDATQLSQMADMNGQTTIERITTLVNRHQLAITGSFLATDSQGRFFNRAFIITPDSQAAFYDKVHLFNLSGEATTFTPGTCMAPVVEFRGWKIRTLVCYDLRFPMWCRNDRLEYDLLVFPSNWGAARQYAYTHLLIARAIENQAYTAGCNRTGSDPWGVYTPEMTQVYDYKGNPIGSRNTIDGAIYATLDHPRMEHFRQKFPVHIDADPLPQRP